MTARTTVRTRRRKTDLYVADDTCTFCGQRVSSIVMYSCFTSLCVLRFLSSSRVSHQPQSSTCSYVSESGSGRKPSYVRPSLLIAGVRSKARDREGNLNTFVSLTNICDVGADLGTSSQPRDAVCGLNGPKHWRLQTGLVLESHFWRAAVGRRRIDYFEGHDRTG